MCMKTSPAERTPGAGRHEYFSAGTAVASCVILSPTSSRSATNSARKPVAFMGTAVFTGVCCTRGVAETAVARTSNAIVGARMDAEIVSYAHGFQFERRAE